MDQYILGMNWSVLVQTSIYQYILVYTCINHFMTFSQCTYRGHTGTVRRWSVQKKCKKDSNTQSSACCLQNLTLHYGVHTSTLECWPILFWVYIDIGIICAPGAWCRIDGAGPAAPCWARNMWQFNDLHFTQLSHWDICCWRDLSVSSLCWNSDVLQPMLCMAYVRWELCTKCTATVHDS